MSNELRDKILELSEQGLTDAEIGRRLNYSREWIRQIRIGAGYPEKTPVEGKAVLSSGEVAKILGVGKLTVRRWADDGILPLACRVGPRQDRRFYRKDIEEFKKKRESS